METVRINALMFRRNGTFVELTTPLDEFWVLLSPAVGYARFVRMGPNRTHVFELREVRSYRRKWCTGTRRGFEKAVAV